MPVITYNPSHTAVSGATLFGDIMVGQDDKDYSLNPGGLKWWALPDQSLGYNIAAPVSAQNQSTPVGVTAGIKFWRSAAKTDGSFLSLATSLKNRLSLPDFATAKDAADWLKTNGYWTDWADIWQFSATTLSWPANAAGYTKYSGGVNSIDDGYTNNPIVAIDKFRMAAQPDSTNVYVSTNGYVTIGSGSGSIISSPQSQQNPAAIAGNPSDNWLQSGLTNTDGDVQDIYYKTGGVSGKSYLKFIVYCGTYGAQTNPRFYLLNLYIDQQFQWVETRVKLNTAGNAGPYNAIDVSQPASTNSQVWRGDLNGENREYLGTGSVIA